MNNKTAGIVIKRSNLGEADRILTIFTERFGKIKAIAKGVRKTTSKLGGYLEPFILLDLELHEGKTFYTVTGASVVKNFPTLHTDLNKIAKAFYIGEMIDRFLEEHQKNPTSFQILIEVLESIEESREDLILRIFELKLIESAGFSPELRNCVHCREKLTIGRNFWDNIEGGVICENCQHKFNHGEPISDNAIKALRVVEGESFDLAKKFKPDIKIRQELDAILTDYVESILEREIKSRRFLGQTRL